MEFVRKNLWVIKISPIFAVRRYKMNIEKIWITDDAIWIRTVEGKEACEKFADYPRLRNATLKQRLDYSTDKFGIHWEALDEDLSFEGFFSKAKPTMLYMLFMAHPELNVSALARRMSISQSLMAQYISGKKKPSETRLNMILETIREVGKELMAV